MAYPWTANDILTASDLNAAIAAVGGTGAWTTYTPTLVQSGAVTKTVSEAGYAKMGRTVVGSVILAVTGTGTANNEIRIGLPIDSVNTLGAILGTGYVLDTSASAAYKGLTLLANASYVCLLDTSTNTNVRVGATGSAMTAALASGDFVVCNFAYQTAS